MSCFEECQNKASHLEWRLPRPRGKTPSALNWSSSRFVLLLIRPQQQRQQRRWRWRRRRCYNLNAQDHTEPKRRLITDLKYFSNSRGKFFPHMPLIGMRDHRLSARLLSRLTMFELLKRRNWADTRCFVDDFGKVRIEDFFGDKILIRNYFFQKIFWLNL